jgi:hypothetical protein
VPDAVNGLAMMSAMSHELWDPVEALSFQYIYVPNEAVLENVVTFIV